jgi:hypothetical protein
VRRAGHGKRARERESTEAHGTHHTGMSELTQTIGLLRLEVAAQHYRYEVVCSLLLTPPCLTAHCSLLTACFLLLYALLPAACFLPAPLLSSPNLTAIHSQLAASSTGNTAFRSTTLVRSAGAHRPPRHSNGFRLLSGTPPPPPYTAWEQGGTGEQGTTPCSPTPWQQQEQG